MNSEQSTAAKVFMTTDISAEGLEAIYLASGAQPSGKIAVKLHTGESPASNFLRPELIGSLVGGLGATIVECNTAYGGSRGDTASHQRLVEAHGFTSIAKVDILDGEGDMSIPVTGGKHLQENFVGQNFPAYDYYIVLSHFKGHLMGGFGGALKNTSIGLASSMGKSWIHSAGKQKSGFGLDTKQEDFLESMAEAASSVIDYLDGRMLFINVMNRISVDCDCMAQPTEPDMHDIGILASLDPVALDQACVDLIYAAEDGASVVERIESRKGLVTLEHAEEIGIGSRQYELVSID